MSDHGHKPNSVPPEWSRRILGAFFAGCVILVVIDLWYHRHIYHPWENLKAFYAIFGFLGLAFLIQVSKGLRRLVMRPEDYYDDPPLPGGEGGGHAG